MQNATIRDVVPLDDRDRGFHRVVSGLVADRSRPSRHEPGRDRTVHTDAGRADIIVPDDVTPLYAQASAALDACNASLTAAPQFLIESTATAPRT